MNYHFVSQFIIFKDYFKGDLGHGPPKYATACYMELCGFLVYFQDGNTADTQLLNIEGGYEYLSQSRSWTSDSIFIFSALTLLIV